MSLQDAPILSSRIGKVHHLTINRPTAGNSLTHEAIHTLQARLLELRDEHEVNVIVLSSSGDRFFCAGHDLKEASQTSDIEESRQSSAQFAALMQTIREQPQVVIAKVRGIATGGGCLLVAGCDLAVAASTARFATPGVNIGLWCWGPMVAVSRSVAPKHAMNMLTRGRLVDAEHAMRIGLVNEVVQPERLDGVVDELGAEIASKSGYTLAMGKEAFYRQLEMPVASAYPYVGEMMARNSMHHDAKEGIKAFVEKREPRWIGRQ